MVVRSLGDECRSEQPHRVFGSRLHWARDGAGGLAAVESHFREREVFLLIRTMVRHRFGGLAVLQPPVRARQPEVEFHLIQPDATPSPLVGPSMGFEASRAALRFGYLSVREWLGCEAAAPLRRRFG